VNSLLHNLMEVAYLYLWTRNKVHAKTHNPIKFITSSALYEVYTENELGSQTENSREKSHKINCNISH